ncbi:DMT family transporter [Actinomycetospora termitidis]|uniref:DMT family transporter n=1 Tax=Actinomycetospora termitidis TaxID=3053470 RepID=A0ABT7MBL1_9PSEU|nr:DMT family transporter [Actinomycetospora sp. Odt1-22]MDL5158055.1 DMT family transporter [Actinomycetospora sp. Odt1-22]
MAVRHTWWRGSTDLTWLVALGAALWGTDALLRAPLAGGLPAASIVFWEHLIIVVVLVPWLPRAWRAFRAMAPRARMAMAVIGAGSSALATVLFTEALVLGDPITPLVLQKIQPLVAALGAAWLLGERLRRGYWTYAVPALVGAWLLAFADPLDVHVQAVVAALLAAGAAVLWAAGTVLGRYVGRSGTSPWDITVLRFAVGLPASLVVLLVSGGPVAVSVGQLPPLVALALVPGLLGLALYYPGLRRTPAARATLAELAFPVTATILGVTLLGGTLTATQVLGLVVVAVSVTALGLRERSRRPVVTGEGAAEPVRARR